VLGLVLTVSDPQYTVPFTTGATVEIDLGRSRLGLPVSLRPGATALAETSVAPQVSAPNVLAPDTREADRDRARIPG
jgi:X-Pro dipeptidyl-peptidase